MNVQEIFTVLEIPETRDEGEIRAAYRRLLTSVNPEDDPEGFKRLRRAYEEALEYIKTGGGEEIRSADWMEERGPEGEFLKRLADIYESLPRRLDPEEWNSLLREPVLCSLDGGEAAKWGLFTYLAEYYRLPHTIWKLLGDAFSIEENEEEFKEHLPENFVDYILLKIRDDGRKEFPLEKLSGPPRADYDQFLKDFFAYTNEEYGDSTEDLERAGEALSRLETYGISHPWIELERAILAFHSGDRARAEFLIRPLLSGNREDEKVQLTGADILRKCGFEEEAGAIYHAYLDGERRTPSGEYSAYNGLAVIAAERESWENALELAGQARQLNNTEEIRSLLEKIQRELIAQYTGRADSLSEEEADRLGWCYIQTGSSEDGLAFFDSHPEYDRDTADFHKMLAVMAMNSKDSERTIGETKLWRACLSREPEESLHQLGLSYHVEARALKDAFNRELEESGRDSEASKELAKRSLKAHDKAVELVFDNIDFRMHRMLLLRDMEEYRQVVDACEKILEMDGGFFGACYYLQEAYEELGMAQEVVDTFYRAKEIYDGNPEIYLRAVSVFKAYKQYKDALGIVRQAEEAGALNPDLMVEKIGLLDQLAETEEDWQQADDYAGEVIRLFEEKHVPDALLAEAYLKRAYLNDSQGDLVKNKEERRDLEYAKRSLKLRDTNRVRYFLGRFYIEHGNDAKEALVHLKLCEERGMDFEWLYYYLGRGYEKLKARDDAIAYYKKTVEKNPENQRTYWRIGWLYQSKFTRTLQREYADQALYYINLQEEKFGPSAEYFRKRATIYLRLRQFDQALKEIEKGIEMDGDSDMWLLKGQIFRCSNRYDEAIASYVKSLEVEDHFGRDDEFCYRKIFSCYLRQRRLQEGVAYFENELKHVEDEKARDKCLESLVDLEAVAGHYDKAISWLEKQYQSTDLGRRACDSWDREGDRIDDVMDLWLQHRFLSEEEIRAKCDEAMNLVDLVFADEAAPPEDRACICQSVGEAYFYLGDFKKASSLFWQAWQLVQNSEKYEYFKSLKSNIMKTSYWLGDLHKAKEFSVLYRKEVEKSQQGCEDLGYSMEELMTRLTTKSKQQVYNLFCSAFYAGDYEQARAYLSIVEASCMCWWCDEDECTEMWDARGFMAYLEGDIEDARKKFQTADRVCWLGSSKEMRMMLRRIDKEREEHDHRN